MAAREGFRKQESQKTCRIAKKVLRFRVKGSELATKGNYFLM